MSSLVQKTNFLHSNLRLYLFATDTDNKLKQILANMSYLQIGPLRSLFVLINNVEDRCNLIKMSNSNLYHKTESDIKLIDGTDMSSGKSWKM